MKKPHGKIIAAVILITAAVVFIILSVFYMLEHQDNRESQKAVTDKGKIENVTIQVSSYQAYRPDSLNFAFVIADIHVSEDPVKEIPLSHFQTSEGIALDQTDTYQNQAEEAGIDLAGMQIAQTLNGGKNEYDAVLFIPVKEKNAESITVTADIDGVDDMVFDLNDAEASTDTIEEETRKDSSVEQGDMKLTAYRLFEVDPADCTQNGERAMLPSSARIFAARISVDKAGADGINIESAEFSTDSGLEISSEDSSFADTQYDNALGQTMHTGDSGCIYFIILSNGDAAISETGTLKLTIDGSDSVLSIQTALS